MKAYMEQWNRWTSSIGEKGQLSGGQHLSNDGRVIDHKGGISELPYISGKASLAGFITILAMDYNDALTIAKDCPILEGYGNSVEIREITDPGN